MSIYSSHERKSDYASKHGAKDGLFIVTLVWFVDSVRKNGKKKNTLVILFCGSWLLYT